MICFNENHFKAMIGKYVPVERIADFKKDLISQTFSDDEIQKHCKELCMHYCICELGANPPLQHGAMKACNLIEKLKQVTK